MRKNPMSAPVLDTSLSPESETFRANAAHNRALAERLRADVAKAALGGNGKSRERHSARSSACSGCD
jgi:3-methylcrotonyl-CoA carboxylase beta subunit